MNQALIANEGSPAIGVTTLAGLKDLKLGAPVGTTSLDAINEFVQPTQEPAVYDDLDLAIKDLKSGQIDGVVVDYPTAFYGYADTVVGQFPNLNGVQEHFVARIREGKSARLLREPGDRNLAVRWHAAGPPGPVADHGRQRPRLQMI